LIHVTDMAPEGRVWRWNQRTCKCGQGGFLTMSCLLLKTFITVTHVRDLVVGLWM
jgi:hypothetical protein